MPSVITRNHNHPAEDPADIKASRGTRKRAREILNHEQKICVAKKQLRKGVPKPISGRDDLSLVQLRNIRYYDQHKDLPSKDPMKNIEDMHTKTGFLFELTTTPLRIIFIPKEAIPFIQKATLLLIDTTFEMADDKEIKITTIMVNTKEDDMFFPAAWMLHKETSKPLYVSFLHALKTAVEGRLSLVAALSDFDQSISGAIKEELRCEWFGDYFHFKQANLKWLHANKLKEYSTQLNHDLGILYHSATRAEWSKNYLDFKINWDRISPHYTTYFRNQWENRINPDSWAFYGRSLLVPSGDNIQEAWHRRAKDELYKKLRIDFLATWLAGEWDYWFGTLTSEAERIKKVEEIKRH
mmetsp:Transcript_11643/g.16156  ORF Transcript_11643/g.16156 Transcript_11643/m.16156 type:complete len:354 (-) Transcript_11643:664-1725(-)